MQNLNSILARLKRLEEKLSGAFINAILKDGSRVTIRGGEALLTNFVDLIHGKKNEEIEKILKVESSDEGGQMIALMKALDAGPVDSLEVRDADRGETS